MERDGQEVVLNIPKTLARKVVGASKQGEPFCNYRFPFVIDSVLTETPAAAAGLQKGDSLVGVNDSTLFGFFDFKKVFMDNKSHDIDIAYYRGDSL